MDPDFHYSRPEHATPPESAPAAPQTVRMRVLIAVFGLLVVVAMPAAYAFDRFHYAEVPDDAQIAAVSASKPKPFPSVSLIANAAVVYDLAEDEIIFSKQESAQLPLASVAKLMTALVASETLLENDLVTITSAALLPDGDSGLAEGEVWDVQDLIDFTLIESSNDGAEALLLATDSAIKATDPNAPVGENAALWRMNQKAKDLRMIQSYFLNGTGLDESATMAGAYGSAEDIARLLAYGIRSNSDVFAATARDTMVITSESGTQHRAVNTNEALNAIPALIAGKTGYTDLAGGNLAIAFDAGLERPMIIVVLGSTQDGRFEDMKTLVDAARAYVSSTE